MKKAGIIKNRYQQMIVEYTRRRDSMREKYGKRPGVPNPKYAKAVKNINVKLCTWRRSIKRIEARQNEIKIIAGHLEEFLGVKVRLSHFEKDKTVALARKLFYKYCLEQGFSSPDVMSYVSGDNAKSGRYYASNARRRFTRSFQTNLHHRVTWDRFMIYMKEHHQSKHQILKRA